MGSRYRGWGAWLGVSKVKLSTAVGVEGGEFHDLNFDFTCFIMAVLFQFRVSLKKCHGFKSCL
ncbi:MAG: hypothetical protein ACJAQT_004378 [Akkermansiaceae bacterium]